jgi:hypothetical protein
MSRGNDHITLTADMTSRRLIPGVSTLVCGLSTLREKDCPASTSRAAEACGLPLRHLTVRGVGSGDVQCRSPMGQALVPGTTVS